jgi:CRP-like cAMP-binding protein
VTALRLRAASPRVRVATWDDAAVEAAFGTCPWVEDELRAAGDRVQALVGATMGALGERLDAALLGQVTGRLVMKVLAEGDVFVEKGQPVPGLLVVGSGELEIANGDVVDSALAPGDFLFATEVLSAGPAPATARAGKGGALVLVADRHVAQELLVTCPPLLEIFAGM